MNKRSPLIDARESDLDVVLRLMQALYQQEHIPFDEARSRETLRHLLRHPGLGALWVVQEQRGEVVGYAVIAFGFSLEYHGRTALLDELYVVEEARGRGTGSRVIEAIRDHCHALDVRVLLLEVDLENEKALRLYERLGFSTHQRRLMALPTDSKATK